MTTQIHTPQAYQNPLFGRLRTNPAKDYFKDNYFKENG